MATVALLRGANLGKRRFSPKALVAALDDLGVVNIGAAGTFVVPKRVGAAALRERIQAELPWEDAEMVLLSEKDVRAALAAGERVDAPDGAKKFGLALPATPRAVALPLEAKAKDGAWAMRYAAVAGRVVIGVRRRWDETGAYSTKAIDEAIGVRRRWDETGAYSTKAIDEAIGAERGTMRDWPTWEKIGAALDR